MKQFLIIFKYFFGLQFLTPLVKNLSIFSFIVLITNFVLIAIFLNYSFFLNFYEILGSLFITVFIFVVSFILFAFLLHALFIIVYLLGEKSHLPEKLIPKLVLLNKIIFLISFLLVLLTTTFEILWWVRGDLMLLNLSRSTPSPTNFHLSFYLVFYPGSLIDSYYIDYFELISKVIIYVTYSVTSLIFIYNLKSFLYRRLKSFWMLVDFPSAYKGINYLNILNTASKVEKRSQFKKAKEEKEKRYLELMEKLKNTR